MSSLQISDAYKELRARRKLEVELNKKIRELNKVLRIIHAAGYWSSPEVHLSVTVSSRGEDRFQFGGLGEAKLYLEQKIEEGRE